MMEILSPMTKSRADRTRKHCVERRRLIFGGVSVVAGALANPLFAIAQAARSDGARKINFSGRQRMLIQRAGKFVCLAHLAPKPLPLLAAAEETLALHQRTEAGLRDGDEKLGLEPETNALVLKALTQASAAFAPYGEIIRDAIESRTIGSEHLQKIAELNAPALNAMDAAVYVIERIYKSEELSERLAMLINLAGRQRMFTQKMVLELCLYRSVYASEDFRQNLFRTMKRFSISLNIMQRVTPLVVPEKQYEPLGLNISTGRDAWEALRARMSKATRPLSDHTGEDVLDIDRRAEDLLKKMNEIVLLYEGAAR